jgi:Xaa-Pro aminopeptidase
MNQDSISQFRTWMAESGLDAFLITQPQNRSYLTGWYNNDTEAGAGMLLVGKDLQVILTSTIYQEAAEHEAIGWQVVIPVGREYPAAIVRLAQEHHLQKIGFESEATSYALYDRLATAGTNIFTLSPFEKSIVDKLRLVKRPEEIELLKRAVAITDETFAHICEWIQPGMTEKEVQWEIARYMVALGADGPAFETIVASGPNGSMPHAHPTNRQIQAGELITIDMGARYKGYCADMTRTICIGEPAEARMYEVYDAVLNAMKTCEAGIHASITGVAADALARASLEMAGLSNYYIHSTGHGVGLQVHEGPQLSARAPEDMVLPAGSVVTIEPGVYIPNWGGVRIEDCGLVTENSLEVLTQSPTKLVIRR